MTAASGISEVRLLHDQRVPMRDGAHLSADVYLPRRAGAFPAILHRTPYESSSEDYIAWAVWWASHGYAAIVQDVRGRYESEGRFHAYVNEAADGYDTVEWIASQSFCDGAVGTWGRSYGALTQWLLAREGPPHLRCMAPHVIMDDYFDDYHYIGGAFQLALSAGVSVIFSTNTSMVRKSSAALFNNERWYRHLPLIDMDVEAIGREIPFWREWLQQATDNEYWRSLSTVGHHQEISAPSFQQCGWFDPYASSTFRNFNAMRANGSGDDARKGQIVLMGPWSHEEPLTNRMGELDFGPAACVDLRQEELRWFDHWLKGEDTGLLDEPPLRIFVMGSNRWRAESSWPLPGTVMTKFYLRSNGRAATDPEDGALSRSMPGPEPADRYVYDPDDPVPTIGGNNSIEFQSAFAKPPIVPGPVDQRQAEARSDVLTYTTEPLDGELEVIGPLETVLYAASSRYDTDFTARLCLVDRSGASYCVAEGIIRARYRNSRENPEPLEPGEVAEYRIKMSAIGICVQPGQRLRLDISSSNFPRFSRNLNTGGDIATEQRVLTASQTVLHTDVYPSHIVLPVVIA